MAIEDVIAEQSVTIANQMLQIAEYAKTEREVELHSFTQIKAFCAKAGVKIAGEFDRTIGSGRPDAHYQGLIIEYKDPSNPATRIGPGSDSAGTKAVVKQIKERFPELERELHYPLKRLMGVGCDGRMLVFVRFRGGRWDVEPPQSVTPHSVERLLRALVSLGAQGKSFTPEYLAADFGSESDIAQKGVRDLYATVTTTKSKKAVTFFNQWKILFGEVCGYDVEGKNTKIQKLGDHYGIPDAQPAELLFAIHTYYAVFMKFLATEIAASFSPLELSTLKACVGAPTSAALRREMESLEQGGIWSQLKITNFLEGDLFAWYLDAWNDRVSDAVRGIVLRLDGYDPTTLSVDPAESRDLLKKLYQQLFPKSVRHDLGEYYTPDWLAEHVLNELGYEGDPDKRLLDPACGSGTFLVIAINRIKAWFDKHRHECGFGEAELVQKILDNVIGFDLNPLAVMASRTNYLMALRDLLRHATSIEIPVYLCDSIMTPAEYGSHEVQQSYLTDTGQVIGANVKVMELKSAVGSFYIPSEVTTSRYRIAKYAETLEFCARNRFKVNDFIVRCQEEGVPTSDSSLHRDLYEKLLKLETDRENGVWARIIKNAFAPLFTARVDYVVGNPPWVGWENLPSSYREETKGLWEKYGLFVSKGQLEKMRESRKDVSMLMLYASVDSYLDDGCQLGFVITQSVFKMGASGEGFRRFQIGDSTPFKILHVDDMAELQPFEGASNRTSVVTVRKGTPTTYPVSYELWRKAPTGKGLNPEMTLDEIARVTERSAWIAEPVSLAKRTSAWLTGRPKAVAGVRKILGDCDYQAREGANAGGASAVYWLRKLQTRPDGLVIVVNVTHGAKRKADSVQVAMEPDLVFPLLRGCDIGRWFAESELHILNVQDPDRHRYGLDEQRLRTEYPRTYGYLQHFRDILESRPDRRFYPEDSPFYTMRNVSDYTLAAPKVVWKRMGDVLDATVADRWDGKPAIPQDTLSFIVCATPAEAHYLCALLNSSPCYFAILSFSMKGGKSFAPPNVLSQIRIPRYSRSNPVHAQLADLSEKAHASTAGGDAKQLEVVEARIDEAAAEVWGLSDEEMKEMWASLAETSGGLSLGSRGRSGRPERPQGEE